MNVQMMGLDMKVDDSALVWTDFNAVILYMCLPEDESKLHINKI